jgi:hypothetical protein
MSEQHRVFVNVRLEGIQHGSVTMIVEIHPNGMPREGQPTEDLAEYVRRVYPGYQLASLHDGENDGGYDGDMSDGGYDGCYEDFLVHTEHCLSGTESNRGGISCPACEQYG